MNIFSQLLRRLREKKYEMNIPEHKGSWNEKKSKLKRKFGYLTENYLMFEESRKEEILVKLQIKLGKTKAELLKIIAEL